MQLKRTSAVPLVAVLIATAALAGCGSSSSPAAPSPSTTPTTTPTAAVNAAAPTPVCPLTGLPPTKHQDRTRPPLAVKIDNVTPALPQAGINNADIVVEELVEGGLTRLMAIFQCDSTGTVGPIRSARISDADILRLLHGSVLGFSGANPADLPPIEKNADTVLISQDADPEYFYRSPQKAAPHNVFSATEKLLKAGIAHRKKPKLKAPAPLFSYGAIDAAAKSAHALALTWPAASALWTWQPGKAGHVGEWLRAQDGTADRLEDGSQINATNVVVLSVTIASTGLRDVLGNASPLDVTVQKGKRPLWVFRNGKVIKGTWTRKSLKSGLILTDKTGNQIKLAPGRTWIELLPSPRRPSITKK
jgi:Protein of unknown function (DUF3048) N-terminal domain/Protein of unknown function (DUF3048) C-terminal domain